MLIPTMVRPRQADGASSWRPRWLSITFGVVLMMMVVLALYQQHEHETSNNHHKRRRLTAPFLDPKTIEVKPRKYGSTALSLGPPGGDPAVSSGGISDDLGSTQSVSTPESVPATPNSSSQSSQVASTEGDGGSHGSQEEPPRDPNYNSGLWAAHLVSVDPPADVSPLHGTVDQPNDGDRQPHLPEPPRDPEFRSDLWTGPGTIQSGEPSLGVPSSDMATTSTSSQGMEQSSAQGFAHNVLAPPQGFAPQQQMHVVDANFDGTIQATTQETLTPSQPPLTTTSSSQQAPSYIQLCTELLSRKQSTTPPATQFIVKESAEVCQSQDSYTSLLTIMASTMVAQGGGMWRMSYQPFCQAQSNVGSVQELLPNDVSLGMGAGVEFVENLCRNCLDNNIQTLDCLGFPVEGKQPGDPVNPVHIMNRARAFQHNIGHATKALRRLHKTTGGVVIYVDVVSSEENRAIAVPLKWYAERIPPSTRSLHVVLSSRCVQNVDGCQEHAQLMSQYLGAMFPRAAMELEEAPTSGTAWMRMMDASVLMCPPSTACLLPALFRDASKRTHLVDMAGMYLWFRFAVREVTKTFHLPLELARDVPKMEVTPQMNAFLAQAPAEDSKECLSLRGRLGSWQQDLQYAATAQYVTPLNRFRAFPDWQATPDMPYREPTTYKWIDDVCPVQLINKQGFCQSMQSLGLTRLYIVGDSLSLQMAMSFWKLLGNEDEPVLRPKDQEFKQWMRFQWSRTIDCGGGFNVELQFTRNDLIDSNDDQDFSFDKISDHQFNCGIAEFCMPWMRKFADYQAGGTLLVINGGTHVHDLDSYPKIVSNFVNFLNQHQRPDDIIMFRTTVPGHENCLRQNARPLAKHKEFEASLVADYRSWHLFGPYNDILYKAVTERNDSKYYRDKSPIQILDVYPMTVLREDGHLSSPPRCSTCREDDCLHYALPGPIDWWTHLMYSNLMNLASVRKQEDQPQATS